jgi:hypothetical protein
VQAMALRQSHQVPESRAAMAKGVEIVENRVPKLDAGDIGDDWIDWIITYALMKEAKALIE